MSEILNNIANLIKVKTIVTVLVLTVWAILALTTEAIPDTVNTIVTMVISFYFGTQSGKND